MEKDFFFEFALILEHEQQNKIIEHLRRALSRSVGGWLTGLNGTFEYKVKLCQFDCNCAIQT